MAWLLGMSSCDFWDVLLLCFINPRERKIRNEALVALEFSPELSSFTMSLAPPVHLFLTDTENFVGRSEIPAKLGQFQFILRHRIYDVNLCRPSHLSHVRGPGFIYTRCVKLVF